MFNIVAMVSKKQIGPVLIAILLLAYVVYRAATLSFTHDEALSYQIIKGDEGLRSTANHHLLNTWLMQLFALFSESEWCLRLPNIIGFVVFAFFTLKIMQSFSMYLQLLFFVPLLFLNNYFLDFFSLARGYGLSLGCMMAALYFLLVQKEAFKNCLYALLFAALAVVSNLNMINFFIGLVALLLVQLAANKELLRTQKLKRMFMLALPALVFFYFMAVRLLHLKEAGQLYYGTESAIDGFDSVVIWSLDLRKLPANFLSLFRWSMFAVWLSAPILLLTSKKKPGVLFTVWTLTTLIIAGLFLEHKFFDALYPQNRTALFIIPLLLVLTAAVFQKSVEVLKVGPILPAIILAAVVAVPMLLQFKERSFGSGVSEWMYDASTKEAALKIHALAAEKATTVSCNWLFRPALSYYSQSRGYNFEIMQVDQPDALNADYIYDFYNQETDLSLGRAKVLKLNQEQTALYIKN